MKKYFLIIIFLLFIKLDAFAIDLEEVVEDTGYKLTITDNLFVNKFVNKINETIQQKGSAYGDLLVGKLSDILDNGNYSTRLVAVLEEIKTKTSEIEVASEKQEVIVDTVINNTYSLENIDISKVKSDWLGLYNNIRKNLGKNVYSYDSTLEKTAFEWSQISKNRGEITHKRNSSDSYYDYYKITSWFKDRGVKCKNIYGVTHSENIGYGLYSCNDGECTDELIDGIKSTFDFYMSEKNKSYKPHYESIISSYFTKIGLGIVLNEISNGKYKYYLTVHYCTELVD